MKKKICSNKEYLKNKQPIFCFKGALLVVGASVMTAKLLPKISSKLYKESVKKTNHAINNNDFEPVIEKIKK